MSKHRENDCLNTSQGRQCALGADHGGMLCMSDDGHTWPMHVPWNPVDGYTPKPLSLKNAPSAKMD